MCHGYKHNTVYSEDFVTLAFTFYAWHCYITTNKEYLINCHIL